MSTDARSPDVASEVQLQDIQPNNLVSKLPFDNEKCPLILSEHGNATALFRYSNSGPFIEFNPFTNNLIPALKHSIIHGTFCIFNFGEIEDLEAITKMLEKFERQCATVHADLYDRIIHNSLTKQSFDSLMAMIPFDPVYEMVPEIYRKSKATFRILFFAQLADIPLDKTVLSLFNCIRVKP